MSNVNNFCILSKTYVIFKKYFIRNKSLPHLRLITGIVVFHTLYVYDSRRSFSVAPGSVPSHPLSQLNSMSYVGEGWFHLLPELCKCILARAKLVRHVIGIERAQGRPTEPSTYVLV